MTILARQRLLNRQLAQLQHVYLVGTAPPAEKEAEYYQQITESALAA